MTIEELNSVKRIREKIDRENQRLEMLRVMSVPTSAIDGLPKAKPLMSMPERVTIAISEAEATLEELANNLIEASAELTEKIFQTFADNPLMSSVLVRMYVADLSADEVARSLGYTRGYIWKVHNQGLKRLTDALPKTP